MNGIKFLLLSASKATKAAIKNIIKIFNNFLLLIRKSINLFIRLLIQYST